MHIDALIEIYVAKVSRLSAAYSRAIAGFRPGDCWSRARLFVMGRSLERAERNLAVLRKARSEELVASLVLARAGQCISVS